jgi:hypothetical protein
VPDTLIDYAGKSGQDKNRKNVNSSIVKAYNPWVILNHGQRELNVIAYHDAVHDNAWAIEVAEVDEEGLEPAC